MAQSVLHRDILHACKAGIVHLPLRLVKVLEELAKNGLIGVVANKNRVQHTRCSINFVNGSLEVVRFRVRMCFGQWILVVDPAEDVDK